MSTRPVRALADALLTLLAHLVLRAFFRRVEIEGRHLVPRDRPVLVVANHGGGFVDPVLLMRVFGRLPRFLAKSTMWDRVGARPFLWLAGLIPVHRRVDRPDGGSGNRQSFQAAEQVLSAGGMVGIFPEGRTHDDASLGRIHTGAARIALGAHAAGVRGLAIVAVGLTFDDKVALRSRVLVHIGEPIALDAVVDRLPTPLPDEPDHLHRPGVRALTDMVADRLRAVAPDYPSFRDAGLAALAAEIRLRPHDEPDSPEVALRDREQLARRIAAAPEDRREALAGAVGRYLLDLEVAGLREEQVAAGHRASTLVRSTLVNVVVLAVLAPPALVGFAWNVAPYLAVATAGRMADRPVAKGTARLLTALAVFPVAWTLVAALDPWDGVLSGVVVFLLAPLLGLTTIAASDRAVDLYLAWRGWMGLEDRRALVGTVRRSREQVVAAVDGMLGEPGGTDRTDATTGTPPGRHGTGAP